MGTNYYVVRNRPTIESPIHIGKSSAGWLFNFQSQNEKWHDPPIVWNTYNQVIDWLKTYTVEKKEYAIINECDEVLSLDDFIEIIQFKQNDEFCNRNKDNFTYSKNVDGYRFTDGEFL